MTFTPIFRAVEMVVPEAGLPVVEGEGLIYQHPAVHEAAVVAMPDRRLGERACAFIVAKEGMHAPSKEDIQRFLDGRGIAKFKWPERIEVRDRLPLTNVQKLDKKILRAEIAALLATER